MSLQTLQEGVQVDALGQQALPSESPAGLLTSWVLGPPRVLGRTRIHTTSASLVTRRSRPRTALRATLL